MPSAGWYQDPHDRSARRWWNGTEWTDHVAVPEGRARRPAGRTSEFRATLLLAAPLIVIFTLAEIVTLNHWWHPLTWWEIAYQLCIRPLIATVLLSLPALVLRRWARSTVWVVAAEVLMVPLIVIVLIAVAADERSTAGIGFVYIPLVGTAVAAAAAGLSRIGGTNSTSA